MTRRFASLVTLGAAVSLAGVAWGQPAPASAPSAAPAASRPTSASAGSAVVVEPELEKILDRLEKRGDTVNDLACKVKQKMVGKVVGEVITKEGELKYLRGSDGSNPRFYIHFAKIDQDGFDLKPESYVFDGRWFIDAKESTRTVNRREIVHAGEKLNLFSVEDSPFPLPFGQKKAEILKNFDVKLLPPAPKDPANTKECRHLLCIPKPGTQKAQEYAQIDFYIDPKLDLPTTIVAQRKTGEKVSEIHTVTFPGLDNKCINKGLPASDFDYKVPSGWQVNEERVQAREPAKPESAR
jgi:hypothetical protein